MLWQAYKTALAKYFMLLIIALMLAPVTVLFWLGLPIYLFGYGADVSYVPRAFQPIVLPLAVSFLLMLYIAPFHWQVAKEMKQMQKTFIALQAVAVLLCAAIIYFIFNWQQSNANADFDKLIYRFPADFAGCAVIFYDVDGAKPLEIMDGQLTFEFQDTVYVTSSPQTFGWASEDGSGWYKTDIYVGEQLIPGDSLFTATGNYEGEHLQLNYTTIAPAHGESCEPLFADLPSLYKEAIAKSL